MVTLTLVVNNGDSIARTRVLRNLIGADGKLITIFHALRNSVNTIEAIFALDDLVKTGIVERRDIHAPLPGSRENKTQLLTFYRYRSENTLYKKSSLVAVK